MTRTLRDQVQLAHLSTDSVGTVSKSVRADLRLIATGAWLDVMDTKTARKAKSAPGAAAELADALTGCIGTDGSANLSIADRTIVVPAALAAVLVELLEDISEGRDVTSAPAGLPVGTELASDLLGVSRPWLTTLLDRGDIPSSRVGSKRRIRLGDLLAYRRSDDIRRRDALTWDFLNQE